MHSFTKLCDKLKINAQDKSQEALGRLINYCREQISHDVSTQGSVEEQFDFYYALLKFFVDTVLPNLHADEVHQPVDEFNNESTLEFLVRKGFDQQIKQLYLKEEDVNVFWGLMSPLHVSLSEGYLHTTDLLLQRGANPGLKNARGETPFDCVLELPISYDERLKKAKQKIFLNLLSTHPNVLEDDSTVLHHIAIYGYPELASFILSSHPEYVLIADNQGRMPIHAAILNRHFDIAKLILQAGPVEQMLDYNRQGPLHYAVIYSGIAMIKLCHSYTNDVDLKDNMGRTPLMLAAYQGHIEALAFLIESGADWNLKDKYGLNALDMCIEQMHIEAAEFLIKIVKEKGEHHPLSDAQKQALDDLRSRVSP